MKANGFVVGLFALGALAACGEIVGLGDHQSFDTSDGGVDASQHEPLDASALDSSDEKASSPPPDPHFACGVASGSATCQACMTENCCVANEACADSGVCAGYENCLVPCAGDYACRARCLLAYPPNAEEIASVNACVAANCNTACGVTCGMTDSFAEPDAANACANCLSTTPTGCVDWESCETNAECNEVSLCVANCTTLDCQSACGYGHDAGATLFLSTVLDSLRCVGACDIGAYWECVGSFEPTLLDSPESVLTLAVTTGNGPAGAGISVTACPTTSDKQCLQPVGAAITDANGNVTFHLPSHVPLDGHAVGFSGYFELSGPAIVPQLAFLEFPLSEPAATMTVSIGVTDGIQMIYDQANVTPDARLGFVWVSADDCHWLPAMGVTVRAMGPGQIPLAVTYDQGGAATGLFGSAYLLDAPIEDITLEVDVPGIGGVVTPVSIFTAPGKMSSIILHPNLYVSARAPIGRPAPTQAR